MILHTHKNETMNKILFLKNNNTILIYFKKIKTKKIWNNIVLRIAKKNIQIDLNQLTNQQLEY